MARSNLCQPCAEYEYYQTLGMDDRERYEKWYAEDERRRDEKLQAAWEEVGWEN